MNVSLKDLLNRLESPECTDLDRYNIKMFAVLDQLPDYVEREINQEQENGLIQINKWPDGTHYYAKVNGIDVVDSNGCVKWDTYEEAMKQANLFKQEET